MVLLIIVPPRPGKSPNFISGNPILAPSSKIAISHSKAISKPPPKHKPFTQAIRGLVNVENNYLSESK